METRFSDLRESNEFLNLLLDNMNSAVLIADEDLQIHHFNDTFLTLFSKSREHVLVRKFGGASGCVFSVQENRACGETSHCERCVIRGAVFQTMVEKVPVDKMRMERTFFIDGKPTTKYLDISTRHISFQGRKMILVILYDVTEIETKKLELQEKQLQLDRDLNAAAGIQRSLLPQYLPSDGTAQIAWHFEPCRQIGGDIFNIHYPEKDLIDLYMLDVCGHGVSAALIAVSVSQFLQSVRSVSDRNRESHSPKSILDSIEKAYPFERFDTYFTMIYMTIDLFAGTLKYGSAGHPPPVLLRSDGPVEVLGLHGPVIGFGVDEPFSEGEIKLAHRDKVVLYTDGILEAYGPTGELYGKERLYKTLERCREGSVKEIVHEIYTDVRSFSQVPEFDDDISILAIEFMS
ncbi:MAG: SpoIIE family protein phosphatase [Desulfoferrobacter sp.]